MIVAPERLLVPVVMEFESVQAMELEFYIKIARANYVGCRVKVLRELTS
jgi:hypothetical protein